MYLQIISASTLIPAILFMLWCLRGISRELKRRPTFSISQVEVDISVHPRKKFAEIMEMASASKRRPFAAGLGKLAALLVATVLFLGNGLARAQDPDVKSREILQLRKLVLKLQSRIEQFEQSQNKPSQTADSAIFPDREPDQNEKGAEHGSHGVDLVVHPKTGFVMRFIMTRLSNV